VAIIYILIVKKGYYPLIVTSECSKGEVRLKQETENWKKKQYDGLFSPSSP
jgi:hypothetical protein